MKYSIEKIQELNDFRDSLEKKHRKLLLGLACLSEQLTVNDAKIFLMQGTARRLKTITRCLENVFEIFPIDRTEKCSSDELSDIAINLHAYFINIAGIFDNLGWVFVYENDLYGRHRDGKLSRHEIGLFNQKNQVRLEPELKSYLTSEPIISWYESYSKVYRDALAHRVPLYVPPAILNQEDTAKYKNIEQEISKLNLSKNEDIVRWEELMKAQESLGSISMIFAHSENESRPVLLHAQLICDYLTVEEVIEKFCTHF